jgi:16S rRNA (uracil1498-N3)-methyltransferase
MASLPLFYHDAPLQKGEELWPGEDTARHVVQVLRMQPGEQLQFTNGRGYRATATIQQVQKKKLGVWLDEVVYTDPASPQLHLCVAFTKNTSRNEWLLEKVTEMGIASITPLLATRTEKERIRYDRWQNILISALLQSQQSHLPLLHEATIFSTAVAKFASASQKLVAHCMEEKERKPVNIALQPHKETVIFIGPEGDFTAEEVDLCEQHSFTSISVNDNRLRTETAAMAACAFFNLLNHG